MSETFDKEIAELWEICSNALIHRYANVLDLEALLRRHGVNEKKVILDVAGGFGFPVIDLAKKEWNIVYNDGSLEMYNRAQRNSDLNGGPGYPFAFVTQILGNMPWQDFNELRGNVWDALICKGNSLPYAVSWAKRNSDLTHAREAIVQVLGEFYRILKRGGILYVDKQPESQTEETEEIGKIKFQGRFVYLTQHVKNDKKNRTRNWTLTTEDVKNGKIETYPSQGYLLLENDLASMLKQIGFRDIEKHNLKGDIYEGFVAKKPKR